MPYSPPFRHFIIDYFILPRRRCRFRSPHAISPY
jgi:hypothetical protein